MRRRVMIGSDNIPGKADAVAGDILCAKENGSKKVFKYADYSSISGSGWTPIGIVVIPPSHDIYGTGEGAVMSIVEMDVANPETGNINGNSTGNMTSMYNGYRGMNYCLPTSKYAGDSSYITVPSGVKILEYAKHYGWRTDTLGQQTMEPSTDLCDPTDYDNYNFPLHKTNDDVFKYKVEYLTIQCFHDNNGWYYTGGSSSRAGVSPYLSDGSKNPVFFIETDDILLNKMTNIPNNCMYLTADIYGKENTERIVTLCTGQPNWRADSTITNSDSLGYYPGPCCCLRYHTIGTEAGDWYLPAIGETIYYGVNGCHIYNTLSKIFDNTEYLMKLPHIMHGMSGGYKIHSSSFTAYYSNSDYYFMYGYYGIGSLYGNNGQVCLCSRPYNTSNQATYAFMHF